MFSKWRKKRDSKSSFNIIRTDDNYYGQTPVTNTNTADTQSSQEYRRPPAVPPPPRTQPQPRFPFPPPSFNKNKSSGAYTYSRELDQGTADRAGQSSQIPLFQSNTTPYGQPPQTGATQISSARNTASPTEVAPPSPTNLENDFPQDDEELEDDEAERDPFAPKRYVPFVDQNAMKKGIYARKAGHYGKVNPDIMGGFGSDDDDSIWLVDDEESDSEPKAQENKDEEMSLPMMSKLQIEDEPESDDAGPYLKDDESGILKENPPKEYLVHEDEEEPEEELEDEPEEMEAIKKEEDVYEKEDISKQEDEDELEEELEDVEKEEEEQEPVTFQKEIEEPVDDKIQKDEPIYHEEPVQKEVAQEEPVKKEEPPAPKEVKKTFYRMNPSLLNDLDDEFDDTKELQLPSHSDLKINNKSQSQPQEEDPLVVKHQESSSSNIVPPIATSDMAMITSYLHMETEGDAPTPKDGNSADLG